MFNPEKKLFFIRSHNQPEAVTYKRRSTLKKYAGCSTFSIFFSLSSSGTIEKMTLVLR